MFNFRLFWSITKRCHADKFLCMFAACLLLGSLIIMCAEPSIRNYGDALWYAFTACTSIGFGEYVAVTAIGRIVTVILTIYEIFIVAMLAGLVVSHYLEVIHRMERHSATLFMDKLEHLTELDEEELRDLQEQARQLML